MTLAQPHLTPADAPPRARGSLRLSSRHRAGLSEIDGLHQQGSAKLLFPRTDGAHLDAMILNTAGGITGGDRFTTTATAGQDSHLRLSTQAAERAYRALPGQPGRVDLRLAAKPGARLDWLPQETLLYDDAALSRRMRIDIAPGATLLAVEALVFGRHAMGETVSGLRLHDSWRVRRGGDLVFADELRIGPDAAPRLADPFGFAGMGAMATVLFVGPAAEAHLARTRAHAGDLGGASLVRDGVLAARLLGSDAYDLRRRLVPLLQDMTRAALPRCWSL